MATLVELDQAYPFLKVWPYNILRDLIVHLVLRLSGEDAVAVHSEGVYPVAPVVVSEALIGSWSA